MPILPCILSHAFINSTSIFAPEPAWVMAAAQVSVSVLYGLWILKKAKKAEKYAA